MSQMNRKKSKTNKDEDKLKNLKQKLKDALAIQAQNKKDGKSLSSGRAKAIAQMTKDIAKLQGKPVTQQQQAFDSMMKKMLKELEAGKPSPRKRIREANKNQSNEGSSPASLRRYEAKSQLSRQKELDAVGPGPDSKKRPIGPTKNIEDRRVTKSVPKTVDTKPRRKTSVESMTNEEIKRGMGSKRKAAEKSGDTTPQRKKPGRFSEENVKRVMKEKFGIDVTYDKGDELDPLVARGEEPGRKKGGMVQFTKRGGMYNKPARKNSKG